MRPYVSRFCCPSLVGVRNRPNCYAKLEYLNVSGCVECRGVLEMLQDAERNGVLGTERRFIEATSGNTGLALASIARGLGMRVTLVVPRRYNEIKIHRCRQFGAEVVVAKDPESKVKELLAQDSNLIHLNQFANPANPRAYYEGTGAEICSEIGKVDLFVCGVGSGAVFSGVSRRLKEANPAAKAIVVQPRGANVLKNLHCEHQIEGIDLNFLTSVPAVFDRSLVDDVVDVDERDVFIEHNRLYFEEGLALGYSSAANVLVASRIARQYPRSRIVTIAHDSGFYYD